MSSIHGITVENLLAAFPYALTKDPHIEALARAVATVFAKRSEEIRNLLIYPNLSQLPEELLDILAYDFKVDWYDYNYPIEAKRDLIKTSFYVHRHLGTKGAVTAALSALYPGSLVEEWFEYGGKPYYFRVILDITEQRVSISNDSIMRAIMMYKSLRSWMEENSVIYRRRETIIIQSAWGFVVYATRLCGTYPSRATQGEIYEDEIVVATDANGVAYTVPRSGRVDTGRYPQAATEGRVSSESLIVESDSNGVPYATPHTNSSSAGQYPQPATQGWATADQIAVFGDVTGVPYATPFNGMVPQASTRGVVAAEQIGVSGTVDGVAYAVAFNGTVPQAAMSSGVDPGGIDAGAVGDGISYSSPMCGATPGSI